MKISDIEEGDNALADLVANHVAEAFRFWVSCYPQGLHTVADGVEMLETGLSHPLGNIVLRCSLTKDAAVERAQAIRENFQEKQLVMSWFVQTAAEQRALPEVLIEAGFECAGNAPAMVASLKELSEAPVTNQGVEVREVQSLIDLEAWILTLQSVFSLPDEMKGLFLGPMQKFGMGPDRLLRYFLATADGTPVGVSAAFRYQSKAGIFCVGTLPDFRGQGIGAAVTHASMAASAKDGLDWAILQSSPLGKSVYQKLGFKTVGTHQRWSIKN